VLWTNVTTFYSSQVVYKHNMYDRWALSRDRPRPTIIVRQVRANWPVCCRTSASHVTSAYSWAKIRDRIRQVSTSFLCIMLSLDMIIGQKIVNEYNNNNNNNNNKWSKIFDERPHRCLVTLAAVNVFVRQWPYLIHASFGSHESVTTLQTASRSVQGLRMWPTDKQTDYATPCVAKIGRYR